MKAVIILCLLVLCIITGVIPPTAAIMGLMTALLFTLYLIANQENVLYIPVVQGFKTPDDNPLGSQASGKHHLIYANQVSAAPATRGSDTRMSTFRLTESESTDGTCQLQEPASTRHPQCSSATRTSTPPLHYRSTHPAACRLVTSGCGWRRHSISMDA